MDDKLVAAIVSILTAVISVSVLSVLLSPKAKTSDVLRAATSGFAGILTAATSPITGQGGVSLGSSSSGGGGFNVGSITSGLTDFGSLFGGGGGALSLDSLNPGGFGG